MSEIPFFGHVKVDHERRMVTIAERWLFTSCFTRLRFAAVVVFGLLLSLSLTGCGSVSSGSDDEHHVIEHKPATFAAAVEQVSLRHERLVTEFQTAEAVLVDKSLSELLDIVGWLTELAADSPMKKPEWDRVNTASKELLVVYQQIAAAAKNQPRGTWPAEANRVDRLMEEVAILVPFSNPNR